MDTAYGEAEGLFTLWEHGRLCWAAGAVQIATGRAARNHVYKAYGWGDRTGTVLCGKPFQSDAVPDHAVDVCGICLRRLRGLADNERSAAKFRPVFQHLGARREAGNVL